MNRKPLYGWILIGIAVILGLLWVLIRSQSQPGKIDIVKPGLAVPYSEQSCLQFVQKTLSRQDGGVYTNYLDQPSEPGRAAGHDILSESVGLMMVYAVERDNQSLYRQQVALLEHSFLQDNGQIGWRLTSKGLETTNATVDDLRILRGLIGGWQKWQNPEDLKLIRRIETRLRSRCIDSEEQLHAFTDETGVYPNKMDLSYFDLAGIRSLKAMNPQWGTVYDQSLELIKGGKISSQFPFTWKTYDYSSKGYLSSNTVNMIDALLVQVHRADVGLPDPEVTQWLKAHLADGGKLYSNYDAVTGVPTGDMESTAVYALAARYGKLLGDSKIYQQAINNMVRFQIQDHKSPLHGAFGDLEHQEVYSFDNLTALLGF